MTVRPSTMADGGIQAILAGLGAEVRVQEARLTAEEDKEYGGWKRLGMALGHFADLVAQNEADGFFTVGLLATCPSIPAWSLDCRYDQASAIGFATIPSVDEGGHSIAAVNRMIAAAVRGLKARRPAAAR